MKPEDILLALGEIDETLPAECTKPVAKKASPWKGIVAAAACIAVVIASVAFVRNLNKTALPVSEEPTSAQEVVSADDTLPPTLSQTVNGVTESVSSYYTTTTTNPPAVTSGFTYGITTSTTISTTTTTTTTGSTMTASTTTKKTEAIKPTSSAPTQNTSCFQTNVRNIIEKKEHTISDDNYTVLYRSGEIVVLDRSTREKLFTDDPAQQQTIYNNVRSTLLNLVSGYTLTGQSEYQETYTSDDSTIILFYMSDGLDYVVVDGIRHAYSTKPGVDASMFE